MGASDCQLMHRIREGDPDAFEDFVRQHDRILGLHLRRYVGPDDAGDLRQEVLLRVWERASQWQGRGSPLAWMLRIATNLALNHLRARRRTASLESGDEAEEAPVAEPPQARGEDDVERWTEASRALELVGELPDSQRTVLSLARLDGLKLREIASRLDVPLGTVKSRLHAATQWLTERWEESE